MKGNRYSQCLIIGWVCHFGLVSKFSVVKLNKERGAVQLNGSLPFFPFCSGRLSVSFVMREGAGVQRIYRLSFPWSQGL